MRKTKVMLAWELGGGLGHVSRLIPLAQHFIEQGCEVVFVLRDLSHVPIILSKVQCATFQAPIALTTPKLKGELANFADILWECGYFSAHVLFGLVAGWQSLYDQVEPDLVLADFAPTALLAARIYDFKRAWLSGGFLLPPTITPWPEFPSPKNTSSHLMREREDAVLQITNTTLQAVGSAPLKHMAELFNVDLKFLCTWPELDCYARPANTRYWGPCISTDYGQNAFFQGHATEGIFCYLKQDQPQAEDILSALQFIGFPALVYIQNLPSEWERKYGSSYLHFSKNAVNFSCLLPNVRLVICPGGEGVIAASLLAGKPLLLVPTQAEQFANSSQLEKIGAGINAAKYKQVNFMNLIHEMINNPAYTKAASAFANKYRDFSATGQIEEIVSTCLQAIK